MGVASKWVISEINYWFNCSMMKFTLMHKTLSFIKIGKMHKILFGVFVNFLIFLEDNLLGKFLLT